LVAGLRQEDFEVFDKGKRQGISTFSVETGETQGKVSGTETGENAKGESGVGVVNALAKPQRFVALVFDDLHMKAAQALAVRAASENLFASLTPTDRVAIYSTQGSVQQDFTGDAETLRKTLAAITPKAPGHCVAAVMRLLVPVTFNSQTIRFWIPP
jgi:VWFA-related protein